MLFCIELPSAASFIVAWSISQNGEIAKLCFVGSRNPLSKLFSRMRRGGKKSLKDSDHPPATAVGNQYLLQLKPKAYVDLEYERMILEYEDVNCEIFKIRQPLEQSQTALQERTQLAAAQANEVQTLTERVKCLEDEVVTVEETKKNMQHELLSKTEEIKQLIQLLSAPQEQAETETKHPGLCH